MRRLAGILAVMAALAAILDSSALARAAGPVNWPQFRFGQQHTGVNPFETTITPQNITSVTLHWQGQLGGLVDFSSPAVVNGLAYLGSTDGRLWAFAAGGCGQSLCTTPRWKSTDLGQIRDSPLVSNGIVYVGSQTSNTSAAGKLDAFSAAGCGHTVCAPLWQGLAGPQSILESSPAKGNGLVFAGAFDGKLYAFPASGCGAATCRPAWTGTTHGHIESTPTVAGGIVYIGSDDGHLYAFKAAGCGTASCRPLWRGSIGGGPVLQSTPAVSNGTVYIGSQHVLAAFPAIGCGAATCPPLWKGTFQNEFLGGSPAVFHGHVYIGLEDGVGVFPADGCGRPACSPQQLDVAPGAQALVDSSPTVAAGLVYAGRNTGEIQAWPAKPCGTFQCTNVFRGATGGPVVSSSPTVVNGKIYIGGAGIFGQGRLFVFGPDPRREAPSQRGAGQAR